MPAEGFKVVIGRANLVFCAGHFISFHVHKCETLHDHNYRAAAIVFTGGTNRLELRRDASFGGVVDAEVQDKAVLLRVLTVDDSSVARKQVSRCLQTVGVEVVAGAAVPVRIPWPLWPFYLLFVAAAALLWRRNPG